MFVQFDGFLCTSFVVFRLFSHCISKWPNAVNCLKSDEVVMEYVSCAGRLLPSIRVLRKVMFLHSLNMVLTGILVLAWNLKISI